MRRERQLEGIAKAKAEGVYKGRPPSIESAKVRELRAKGTGGTEQDTFTFNAGFITAHKVVEQSSAKTAVDTVTAPIRALIPSVTVQQILQMLFAAKHVARVGRDSL